jgi:hypothetical protein
MLSGPKVQADQWQGVGHLMGQLMTHLSTHLLVEQNCNPYDG